MYSFVIRIFDYYLAGAFWIPFSVLKLVDPSGPLDLYYNS